MEQKKAMEQTDLSTSLDDLVTWDKFVDEAPHELITRSFMQTAIRNRQKNGLQDFGAIVKKGNRICVIKSRFAIWLLSN